MTTFEDRQKALFNKLNAAEREANFVGKLGSSIITYDDGPIVNRRVLRKTKSELKQFRGKESIFKRPEAPLSDCLKARNIPGFRKNPNKWICYNLESVPDMTDRNNAEAAAIFHKESVTSCKRINSEDSMELDTPKLIYRTPVKDTQGNILSLESLPESDNTKKITYKDSKIILPQYVIGKPDKSSRPTKKQRTTKDDTKPIELRLHHLHDEEDEFD